MACNYKADCGVECFDYLGNYVSTNTGWTLDITVPTCAGRCQVGIWTIQQSTTYKTFYDYTDPAIPPDLYIYTLTYSKNGGDDGRTIYSGACTVDNGDPYNAYAIRETWEYYDYDNAYLYYSSGYWRQSTPYMWDIKMYLLIGSSDWFPSCPDGSYFDPVTGLCECSEGWDCSDPDNPIPPYCLEIEGPAEVDEGDTAQYRVFVNNQAEVERDVIVYISYLGSTAKDGEDYNKIDYVTLKEGTNEVFFDIETIRDKLYYENDEKLNITIAISEDYTERVCVENVLTTIVNNPNPEDDGRGNNFTAECCAFFTPKFVDWMSCTNFDEPEYPGNMLKDGTILE